MKAMIYITINETETVVKVTSQVYADDGSVIATESSGGWAVAQRTPTENFELALAQALGEFARFDSTEQESY